MCVCVSVCVRVCVCVCVCVCSVSGSELNGKHRLVSSRLQSFTELLQSGTDPGHKEEETRNTTLTLSSGFQCVQQSDFISESGV